MGTSFLYDVPDTILLFCYYDSGQWLRDYETDEAGLLPKDLKRGVLSEDAVYNFLADIFRVKEE